MEVLPPNLDNILFEKVGLFLLQSTSLATIFKDNKNIGA
jgi:hypothetical protein